MSSKKVSESPQPRVIRVFVSSTFRDMHQEREELVKFIFPKLRKLCEERGVTWGEVDLRWGITSEQKAEGKVLPICLAEIHRCRPYFIGLLGERYGWVPHEIPQEIMEQEPWLTEHLDHSVTELEILHGVLRNPEMADNAYFYFRDPAYIYTFPDDQQADFREHPTRQEIEDLGSEEAERRAKERRQKLKALKDKIHDSGFPVRENYRDPKELGELVLRDLTEVINRLFPEEEVPDPLDREAAEHEAFAESRRRVYIGRKEYFDRLDEHVKGESPPLVIIGDSGSGKSALLANWALQYRGKHPDEILIMHFIGSSPQSTNWMAMLRRIMGEFKRMFNIQDDIPDQAEALRESFANWLHMVAARGKAVITLDALNQLEDRDQALDLVWLPPEIPSNVRFILSTLPGRPLDDLKKREWPTRYIKSLHTDEKKKLITEYLAQYTKSLSENQVDRIVAVEQTANPLYLRALLEELRVFGEHEQLEERLGYYLKSKTIPELYEKILERYEQDYERDCPDLVKNSMSLLWAARRGLSEAELLEMLGSFEESLPGAYWSPLFLAAEQAFVIRSGLIGFSHDYFRQAVQNQYLPTEQEQKKAHLHIADYFKAQDLGARKVDELPWQLSMANAWQRLYDLLADQHFLDAAWKNNEFEVKAYWAQVESNTQLNILDAYQRVIKEPKEYDSNHVWQIATLLHETGYPSEALILRDFLVEHYRDIGDHENLQRSLDNQAQIIYRRGDLDGAMALLNERERICRELGNKDGVAGSLGGQANILHARGDLVGAMALHKAEERIFRELGNKAGLQGSLGNQALILKRRGRLDRAMALHKEQERICRELGDKDGVATSLGNQANILHARGDLVGAMALHKEQERICRELGKKDGLQLSLGGQANILSARGDLEGAMALHKEQERICRELGNKAGVAASLVNQALIIHKRGDLDGAMALFKEQERICRELGKKDVLAISLINQSVLLAKDLNQPHKALPMAEEAYELAMRHGFPAMAQQQIKPILDFVRSKIGK